MMTERRYSTAIRVSSKSLRMAWRSACSRSSRKRLTWILEKDPSAVWKSDRTNAARKLKASPVQAMTSAASRALPEEEAAQGPFLRARPGAVVVAGQVEEPVEDEDLDLPPEGVPARLGLAGGDRDGDDDVAEVETPVRPPAADGEAQDVGRPRPSSGRSG